MIQFSGESSRHGIDWSSVKSWSHDAIKGTIAIQYNERGKAYGKIVRHSHETLNWLRDIDEFHRLSGQ